MAIKHGCHLCSWRQSCFAFESREVNRSLRIRERFATFGVAQMYSWSCRTYHQVAAKFIGGGE